MFPCFEHAFNLVELVEHERVEESDALVDLGLCPLNTVATSH